MCAEYSFFSHSFFFHQISIEPIYVVHIMPHIKNMKMKKTWSVTEVASQTHTEIIAIQGVRHALGKHKEVEDIVFALRLLTIRWKN